MLRRRLGQRWITDPFGLPIAVVIARLIPDEQMRMLKRLSQLKTEGCRCFGSWVSEGPYVQYLWAY